MTKDVDRKLEFFDLDLIEVHGRIRSIDDDAVASLAASIEKIGLRTPISVRYYDERPGFLPDEQTADALVLMTGAHRLEAAKRLGWQRIECFVYYDGDEVDAQLWEIAENLHRAELSKLERDEQIARWVELSTQKSDVDEEFEAFYAAVSGNDAGAGNSEPPKPSERVLAQVAPKPQGGRPEGGIRAASRELGIDRDDARRAVKVASLSDEAKTVAREMGLDDNRTALLDAARHGTPEAQVKALQERKQSSIAARIEPPTGPTYEELRAAILLLADLKPEDFTRLCPPPKRAAMCQKLAHLEQVFGQVREAVSA